MAKNFTPSIQQKHYFDWITNGTGSCILEAVAGSGKTTTLIEGLKLMTGDIFFGAYNKSIAVEIQARAPKNDGLVISTMHAAGLAIWKKHIKKFPTVDADKCRNIFIKLVDKECNEWMNAVINVVSFAKQAAFGVLSIPTDADWYDLIDYFNVDTNDNDGQVVELAKFILTESIKLDSTVVDFDDMIYAPLIHKCKPQQYEWILIDEAQDTNESRRLLSLMMLKKGGRLVAVGDSFQAIYQFTGANSNSLDLIADATNAVRLPLTVSYRCPTSIVKYAQQYVPHIQAHKDAIQGKITHLEEGCDLTKIVKAGDVILCRFNAPNLRLVYKFITAGIAAKIAGRDIGNGMKTLARKWKVSEISVLQDRLEDYRHKEIAKLIKRGKMNLAGNINDKVDCLNVIIARVIKIDPKCSDPVDRICKEIDNIFGDNVPKSCVLLSSIHKAKGREWDSVFIYEYDWSTRPDSPDWVIQGEYNLKYVAITRAKKTLRLVPKEQRKDLNT
jgi:superfamily I DNA/RNA helicase